jgi:peptide/nickel transport system permease protein
MRDTVRPYDSSSLADGTVGAHSDAPDAALELAGHGEFAIADETRRRRPSRGLRWAAAPLALLILLALLAPVLPLPDPSQHDLPARLTPPWWAEGGSWTHPLGTDQFGRDMLSRLLHGARLTLFIAAAGVALAASLGTVLGMVAGYSRGWVDTVISRVVDAQLAIPFMLLAIAIISSRGRSLALLIFVLVAIGWAQFARVIRSEVLSLRERPFILSLRAAGVPTARLIARHVLPNVFGTVVVLATLETVTMVLAESALSFLGLGVVEPNISWGSMLAEGRDYMTTAWWLVTLPGLAITIVVVYINLLGDRYLSTYGVRKRDASR